MYFGARIKHFRPSSLAASLLLFFGLVIGSLTGSTALFFGMVGITDHISKHPFVPSEDKLTLAGGVDKRDVVVELQLDPVRLPAAAIVVAAKPAPPAKVAMPLYPPPLKSVEVPPGPAVSKEVLALAALKDEMADMRDAFDSSSMGKAGGAGGELGPVRRPVLC